MLLYIVRHGLTPWNHLHKAQGSADIPLAQEGIDLARRTGEALMDVKFDICFTRSMLFMTGKRTMEFQNRAIIWESAAPTLARTFVSW